MTRPSLGRPLPLADSTRHPGDVLRIYLENQLVGRSGQAKSTKLHTHGPDFSPIGNMDNVPQAILGGYINYYIDRVPTNQDGVFWNHSHLHGDGAKQVYRGLVGLIVVVGKANSVVDRDLNPPMWVMTCRSSGSRPAPSSVGRHWHRTKRASSTTLDTPSTVSTARHSTPSAHPPPALPGRGPDRGRLAARRHQVEYDSRPTHPFDQGEFYVEPRSATVLRNQWRKDLIGEAVFHCHDRYQEGGGMMALLNVIPKRLTGRRCA